MTEEQLDRLRAWAATLAKDGGQKAAAGRTIQALVERVDRLRQGEEGYLDRTELFEARQLARKLSSGKGPAARRSAARAITLLLEEHDRLDPPPPELVPAWSAENGGNGGQANGSNGSADVDGDELDDLAEPLAVQRTGNGNGASASLRAPRRSQLMPPRQAYRPPPRGQEGGGVSTALGSARPRPTGAGVRRVLYWLIGGAIVVGTFIYAPRLAAPDIEVTGPTSDLIGIADADVLVFQVSSPAVANARWSVDGKTVEKGTRRQGATSTYRAVALPQGDHRVAVEVPGSIPGATAKHEWSFRIDLTPPEIVLAENAGRAQWGKQVTIAGEVEPDGRIRVGEQPAPVEDGRFALRFDPPRQPTVLVTATDPAGNVAQTPVALDIAPRLPRAPVRAVHVTFYAWKFPQLRAPILDLVDSGKVNVVELDLKDESGIVGFDADIPLGRRMGSVQDIYNLRQAVRMLHAKGVTVIGRLVAFRDPIHAAAAWKAGRKAEVVQTPDRQPYAGYGGFTNFANPAVRKYNIDIAKAAVAAGVDEILYDYIRRPDGPRSSMRFPGLEGPADRSIADFLRETREALPTRIFLGASVFGVAVSRPQDVAQNVPMMAREIDYIAPLVYPSHWSPDSYGVANPNAQPYDIVLASLRHFERQVDGTGARIVPWLQDFSLGVTYGPDEVRAQIEAAKQIGVDEWILWNPLVRYTSDALEPHDRLPPVTP